MTMPRTHKLMIIIRIIIILHPIIYLYFIIYTYQLYHYTIIYYACFIVFLSCSLLHHCLLYKYGSGRRAMGRAWAFQLRGPVFDSQWIQVHTPVLILEIKKQIAPRFISE